MFKHIPRFAIPIVFSLPLVLWAALLVLPTFDDWTTLSSPNYDPRFLQYLLPFGMTWRPGDAMMGYVNAIDYRLFPSLNHLLIVAAHLCNTFLVYKTGDLISLSPRGRRFSTLFFYWSPCMLGTVLSCDALNQSFSHLWGLMALWVYLTRQGARRLTGWAVFTLLSVWSKDNGLAWAVVPPLLAYGFHLARRPVLVRHLGFALLLVAVYALLRLLLPATHIHNGSYAEDMVSLHSRLKGLAVWLAYTWSPTDYISLLHAPSRRLWLAAVTCLAGIPLMLGLLCLRTTRRERISLSALVLCFFIVASPHLLISMSIMNTYASLGMAALIIGWTADHSRLRHSRLDAFFVLYLAAATVTNVHHWYKAWQTSLPGREIARKIVKRSFPTDKRVRCIIIRDDYPKYSSFCVPTDEAFGWGRAVWQETGYAWPQTISDTTIERSAHADLQARHIAQEALMTGYQCAWIINKKEVKIIR